MKLVRLLVVGVLLSAMMLSAGTAFAGGLRGTEPPCRTCDNGWEWVKRSPGLPVALA